MVSEIILFCYEIAKLFTEQTIRQFKANLKTLYVAHVDSASCQNMLQSGQAILGIMYNLAGRIDITLHDKALATEARKFGVEIQTRLSNKYFEQYMPDNQSIMNTHISKIRIFDSSYTPPEHKYDPELAPNPPLFGMEFGKAVFVSLFVILFALIILYATLA